MGRADSNSGVLSARAFSIQSCVGMLHQNKRVAREEGLKDLVAALEGFACVDDHRYEQALDRCFYFLQNGSAKEKGRKDAYRAIGLYALTVGRKAEQTLLDRLFHLGRLATMVPSSPSDAERAVAAIDCVAAATIATAKQPWEAERTLKAIWEVIQQTATAAIPQVLAAAVSAWTVVLPAARYIEDDMTPFVLIAKLLRADDDEKCLMAGGEALTVCIELDILPRQPKYYWYNYYYSKTKPPEPEPDERPALERRVSELAFGVNARKKKAHAGEIGLFQQIDDFLKKNEQQLDGSLTKNKQGPRESVIHGGCVVKVSRWAKLVQLNFLRYYIGAEGFYTHFRLNLPLFRDSLGLTWAPGGRAEKEDLPAHEEKQLRKHRDRHSKAVKRDLQDKMQQYA